MKILWNSRIYPPTHCRGAEMYAHEINKHMISQGHEVLVMLEKTDPYQYEGVNVVEFDRSHYKWADLVFCHLETTDKTVFDCHIQKKPCIFIAHNTFDFPMIRRNHWVGVIFNCTEGSTICDYHQAGRRSFIFPPPVDIFSYKVVPGNSYTLINLCENKGSKTFYEIAEMMPDKHFIGVRGAYHNQVIKELPNVEILPNTPDVRSVYSRTRILLMPSRYESWGRTATEAMASGIPVICHPTFGLKENCGSAGYYVDRSKPQMWVDAINDIESNYGEWSVKATHRAHELIPDYTEFDLFLLKMTQ